MGTLQDIFDGLDSSLNPVPRFLVEPKDKSAACEIERQTAFLSKLRIAAPAVMAWAVPNAGKRGPKAQAQAKKEGLKAGCFDLHLAWNHGYCVLEFKDGTGPLSDAQIDWGNAMFDRGHRVACVRSPEFALEVVEMWGAPFLSEACPL